MLRIYDKEKANRLTVLGNETLEFIEIETFELERGVRDLVEREYPTKIAYGAISKMIDKKSGDKVCLVWVIDEKSLENEYGFIDNSFENVETVRFNITKGKTENLCLYATGKEVRSK